MTISRHVPHAERISLRAVEPRSTCFGTVSQFAAKITTITVAVALPVLAIANAIETFSYEQNSSIQDPTLLDHNYTLTSQALNTSSTCTHNFALGFFSTLLTHNFLPMLAGLLGCVPGASAQSNGSSSSQGETTISGLCLSPVVQASGLPVQVATDFSVTGSQQVDRVVADSGFLGYVNVACSPSCFVPTPPATIASTDEGGALVLMSNGSPLTDAAISSFANCITYQWTGPSPAEYCEFRFKLMTPHLNGLMIASELQCNIFPLTSTPAPAPSAGPSNSPTVPSNPVTATPGTSPAEPSRNQGRMTAIIGGAVGGIVVIGSTIVGLICWRKHKKKPTVDQEINSTRGSLHTVTAPDTNYQPFNEQQVADNPDA